MSHYLSEGQRMLVGRWWASMQPGLSESEGDVPEQPTFWPPLGRAGRAALRHCASVDELLLEPAAHRLAHGLLALEANKERVRLQEEHYPILVLLAGVLAWVRRDMNNRRSLAHRLGSPVQAGQSRIIMSELRFKRLQKARDRDDFYRQLIRAIRLADQAVDVSTLADDIVAWGVEQVDRMRVRPTQQQAFRWANDYYSAARATPKATKDMA